MMELMDADVTQIPLNDDKLNDMLYNIQQRKDHDFKVPIHPGGAQTSVVGKLF